MCWLPTVASDQSFCPPHRIVERTQASSLFLYHWNKDQLSLSFPWFATTSHAGKLEGKRY